MRKIIVTLLAVWMVLVLAPDELLAEEFVSNEQEQIKFDYSDSVIAGTIRYISQVPTGENFHTEYWPENNFGRYSGATRECKTSCISMALSYLGIDRTPADILLANNGATKVDGWGATYRSVDVNSGMTDYLTGKGIFSPVLIHLPKYSGNGHYILLVDKISENSYQALDPWECAVTSVQIDGNSATYTKSGKVINDTIDISGQWYLYQNTIDDNADIKEDDTQAEEASEAMEEPKALSKLKITSLTSTSAKLSWKNQSDATGYKVYQKVSGESYKLVKTVQKNSCKVYLKTGKKYYFKVIPYIQYETQKIEGKAGKCEYFCKKLLT